MFDKGFTEKLHHLKGHRLAESLQVLHCLREHQWRDQFLLSAMPLAKSPTSAEHLGGISLQGLSESLQYTILWSFQGCLWSCWGLCQLRIGASSHYLGRGPSAWGAGQKGWFACADCSNGSLTGRDPSTAQECQLSHCTGHWSHNHRRVLYWHSLWFQKMFLNAESSSINHTLNVFIKVIPTQLASSTQERSSTEWPRTTQWEITEASSISISCAQPCLGETQNPSQVPKWKVVELKTISVKSCLCRNHQILICIPLF